MLSLYDVLLSLVVFGVLVPVEVVRIACGRSTWSRLELRLGRAKGEAAGAGGGREGEAQPVGSLVVHAVSAGEMQAAGILVAALCRRLPEIDVVLTAGTEDGLQVGEAIRRRCPQVRGVELLPWDRRRAVDRFLERHAPRLVVVVETEIWPGLFTACARRAVPLWLVSGRLRSRDVRRYRLAPRFFRRVLGAASWIGVSGFLISCASRRASSYFASFSVSLMSPFRQAESAISPPECCASRSLSIRGL